jgi:hypothetical protein
MDAPTVCNALRAEEFDEYIEARPELAEWTDDERGAARKFMDEALAIEDLMELDPMEVFDLELHAGFKMGEVYSGDDRNDIRLAQSQREKMDMVLLRLENNVGGYKVLLEFLCSPVIERDNLARRMAYEESKCSKTTAAFCSRLFYLQPREHHSQSSTKQCEGPNGQSTKSGPPPSQSLPGSAWTLTTTMRSQ